MNKGGDFPNISCSVNRNKGKKIRICQVTRDRKCNSNSLFLRSRRYLLIYIQVNPHVKLISWRNRQNTSKE